MNVCTFLWSNCLVFSLSSIITTPYASSVFLSSIHNKLILVNFKNFVRMRSSTKFLILKQAIIHKVKYTHVPEIWYWWLIAVYNKTAIYQIKYRNTSKNQILAAHYQNVHRNKSMPIVHCSNVRNIKYNTKAVQPYIRLMISAMQKKTSSATKLQGGGRHTVLQTCELLKSIQSINNILYDCWTANRTYTHAYTSTPSQPCLIFNRTTTEHQNQKQTNAFLPIFPIQTKFEFSLKKVIR